MELAMENLRKGQGDLFGPPPKAAFLPGVLQAKLRPLLLALLSEAATIATEAQAEGRVDDQDHA